MISYSSTKKTLVFINNKLKLNDTLASMIISEKITSWDLNEKTKFQQVQIKLQIL